jgi:cyanophycinase
MTGGDQTRLTDALSGDSGRPVLRELERLLERGGVIAGTSAGAAVMGDLMITGNEMSVPEADLGFRQINAMTVERIDGFSFWKGVIVDQHFVWRRRHNRLLSLVLERPELVGVGIDEATAVVVDAEGNFEVIGLGTVTVYDGRGAQVRAPDAQGLPSAQNLRLHVLRAGDHFELGLQTHRPATE